MAETRDPTEDQSDLEIAPLDKLEAKLGTTRGYALVWFLINDRVKLLGYRILDMEGEAVIAQRATSAVQPTS